MHRERKSKEEQESVCAFNMSASIEALLMAADFNTSYIDYEEHDECYIPPYLLACNYEFHEYTSDKEDTKKIYGSNDATDVQNITQVDGSVRDRSEDIKSISDEKIANETMRKYVSWIEDYRLTIDKLIKGHRKEMKIMRENEIF